VPIIGTLSQIAPTACREVDRARNHSYESYRSMHVRPVAYRHQATLLAADGDMSRVARIVGIDLDDASIVY